MNKKPKKIKAYFEEQTAGMADVDKINFMIALYSWLHEEINKELERQLKTLSRCKRTCTETVKHNFFAYAKRLKID